MDSFVNENDYVVDEISKEESQHFRKTLNKTKCVNLYSFIGLLYLVNEWSRDCVVAQLLAIVEVWCWTVQFYICTQRQWYVCCFCFKIAWHLLCYSEMRIELLSSSFLFRERSFVFWGF